MNFGNKNKPEAIHPLKYQWSSFQLQPWKQPSWVSDAYKKWHRILCQKYPYLQKNLKFGKMHILPPNFSITHIKIRRFGQNPRRYKGEDHGCS